MAKGVLSKVCAWGVAVCVLAGAVACRGGGENQPAGAEAASDGGAEAWLGARMAVRAACLAVATGWGVAKNLPRLMRGKESHVGEYGPAFNGERRKFGIPGIPADWVLTEDGGQCFTYGKPSAEGGPRAEITVCCNRKTGAISSEEHRYYSGRMHSVEGEGGDWPECVLFRYTYGKPENPWWFHYDHDVNCGECREKGRDLGPEGFDALLEEWGFERVFAPEEAEGRAARRPPGRTAMGRRDAAGCRIPQGATGTKVGSMAWKISGIWVPCHGKTAQFGFHGVEKRRIRVPWRGSFPKRRLPLRGAGRGAAWA